MNTLGENTISGNNTIDIIDGDLSILGNLDVSGVTTLDTFTANSGNITGTLQVGTLISDLVIEDPIIQIAKGNTADNINMGIVSEHNDGSVKYSGVVRSKDNKAVYVLENIPSLINSTEDIRILNRGNFVVNDFIANDIVIRDAYINGVVKIGANLYTLPLLGGTIGQVLISNGDNTTTFQTSPINTMQTIYDDSTSSQIITTASNPIFQIREKINPSLGQMTFEIRNAIDTESYFRVQNTGIGIGDILNGYDLPFIKGTQSQVLRINALDVLEFGEPYNQPLNNNNSVIFRSIGIQPNNNLGSMLFDSEGVWQTFKISTDGSKGNIEVNAKSRGTLSNPEQVLNGDSVYESSSLLHDGTSYQNGHSILIKATQDTTNTGGSGVSMAFETTNNGSTNRTRKMLIDSDGLTIGNDINGFILPFTKGTQGQVLMQTSNNNVIWGNPGGLFTMITSTNVTGTVETSIIGAGVGSLTIPENTFTQSSFLVKIGGKMSADNNNTITIKIKSNAVIICELTTTLEPISNDAWEAEIDFTIKQIGAAGVAIIHSNGNMTYQATGNNGYLGQMVDFTNDTTFDTTISNTLDITVEMSSGTQQIDTNQVILNRLYP